MAGSGGRSRAAGAKGKTFVGNRLGGMVEVGPKGAKKSSPGRARAVLGDAGAEAARNGYSVRAGDAGKTNRRGKGK